MPASGDPAALTWVAVARLLRPQGRRGELLAEPLSDIEAVFQTGRVFQLSGGASTLEPLTLLKSWRPTGRNAGRIVFEFDGVESIDAAEALQGKELLVSADDMPSLEADTYLVGDLTGCTLFDGDHAVGTIIGLQFPVGPDGHSRLSEAADLLFVRRQDEAQGTEELLVPFVKAWLQEVDINNRRVSMTLPAGLLEEPDPEDAGPAPEI